MVHNLNSLHARAGAQIPFSSINFGTATSWEDPTSSFKFPDAVDAGLGKRGTPIFPISIFKMKKEINVDPEDPNYDLFQKSSARQLRGCIRTSLIWTLRSIWRYTEQVMLRQRQRIWIAVPEL